MNLADRWLLFTTLQMQFLLAFQGGGLGGGVLPYMGYIGMCGSKGYGVLGYQIFGLVINRVGKITDFGLK